MQQCTTLILLFAFSFSQAQLVDLINENFDNGIPAGWHQCSGNWGAAPQWTADSGALRESSGPYFGHVINALVLPPVDLTSVSEPELAFELAMAETDSNIRLSVWYTTDTGCSPVWDTVNNFYLLAGWTLLSGYDSAATAANTGWKPSASDYQAISVGLSQISSATDIRFCLAAEYMNVYANGVWYLDNIKIYGNEPSGISENQKSYSFRLFPNPTDNAVHFTSDQADKEAVVVIRDISGKVISEQSAYATFGELDVSGYKPGLYLVQYVCSKGVSANNLIIH